ncbi:uncharacterized protein LOC116174734 isoform X2 [Photinus pyralis]|uniref:uncharacterized protein LOC116174734 isoform X2 n=1 Tax=Photinus pyralis TaxID=7054 RepID=UPI0012677BB3|nr:uncharacterized protein LOC116174734 isoform X2 [Photinus pyralis]
MSEDTNYEPAILPPVDDANQETETSPNEPGPSGLNFTTQTSVIITVDSLENESSSSSSATIAPVSTTTQTTECTRHSRRKSGIFRFIKAKSEGNLAEQVQDRQRINASWSQRLVGIRPPCHENIQLSNGPVSAAASQTHEDDAQDSEVGGVLGRYYRSLVTGANSNNSPSQVSSFFYIAPPITGAPPSYSAIMRMDERRLHETTRSGITMQPSAPFIAPRPPPSYTESLGITTTASRGLELYAPSNIIGDFVWGAHPTPVVCHMCEQVVLSLVRTRISTFTHIVAAVFCMFGCWPCCFIPYFIDSCKNVTHHCPNCNAILGMYTPT